MTRSFLQLMLVIFLTAWSVPVALADYYKYTDAGGAAIITNKLESVPQKYRSRMKVIKDETLSKQDTGARKQQQAAPAQEENSATSAAPVPASAPAPAPAQGKIAELSARHVWFQPLLYLAAFFAALFVVIKLASLVESGPLSKLIYLSFFLGVSVFCYKAYVEHVVAESLEVKQKTLEMVKKAHMREVPFPGEPPSAENK